MGPNAYDDLLDPSGKIVFIYITSGDDKQRQQTDYYKFRETGAIKSASYVRDMVSGFGNTINDASLMINGHILKRYEYKYTVHYFLRLPDNVKQWPDLTNKPTPIKDPDSYAITDLVDLWNKNATIRTIDGSNTYNRQEIINTVHEIYRIESINVPHKFSNRFRYDIPFPGGSADLNLDHPDHTIAGRVSGLADVGLGLEVWGFVGYPCNNAHSTTQYAEKEKLMWQIAAKVVADAGYGDTREEPSHLRYASNHCYSQMAVSSRPVLNSLAISSTLDNWIIYPNPAQTQVTVAFSKSPIVSIEITDVRGIVCARARNENSTSHTQTLNISALQEGLYFLRITGKDNVSQTKKLLLIR